MAYVYLFKVIHVKENQSTESTTIRANSKKKTRASDNDQLLIDHCQKLTKIDIKTFTSNTCGAEYKHGNIFWREYVRKKENK